MYMTIEFKDVRFNVEFDYQNQIMDWDYYQPEVIDIQSIKFFDTEFIDFFNQDDLERLKDIISERMS